MSINKAIIIGRLTRDPELKYIPSGSAVCNFSLATNEKWKSKDGGDNEKVQFHNIVVWGKQAEHCSQYLAKGRECYIEGAIETRTWDDKDGKKNYTTEINAKNVQFLGGNNIPDSAPAPKASDEEYTANDIPF